MKKNFFFALAAISMLTLASCETENPAENNPAGGAIEGIPTTATITLTNAPTTMASEAGTAEENKLAEATLYVFNNADVLESIVTFQTADITAKKVTFNTTTGAKRLFVCANMNEKLAALNFKTIEAAGTTGSPTALDQFKKTILTVTIPGISANNKFWMTNLEAQPAQVQVVANGANAFTVNVGRACAKVSLAVGNGVTGSGGALTSIKFKTKNNPNKIYFMPVYDGANYTGAQLLTPYYATSATGTYIDGSVIDLSTTPTTPKSTYMVENSNQTILGGKATYLEVEGIWTPDLAHTRKADGTPATTALATGSDFWRIGVYDKAATATDKKLTGYKDAFCYSAVPTNLGTNEGAIKYTGGKSFYAIYVQDKNAGTDQQLPLRYTIMRNSFFKVVISSISGPGSSTEQGVVPDPDQPVETTTNMNVTVTVADWTVSDLNAGI